MKKRVLYVTFLVILSQVLACTIINNSSDTEEVFTHEIKHDIETNSFSFLAFSERKGMLPFIEKLMLSWGKAKVHPVHYLRERFEDYFVEDEYLGNRNPSSLRNLYNYNHLFVWDSVEFKELAEKYSVSILLEQKEVYSDLWLPLFPAEWDSISSLKFAFTSFIEIRFLKNKSSFDLSSTEIEYLTEYFQEIIEEIFGSKKSFHPSVNYLNRYLEKLKKRNKIRSRLPVEFQKSTVPIVGFPIEREAIDLKISLKSSVKETLEYQIKLKDSNGDQIIYEIISPSDYLVSHDSRIRIPLNNENDQKLITYIISLGLKDRREVDQIILQKNDKDEFIVYQKGDEVSLGFKLDAISLIEEI